MRRIVIDTSTLIGAVLHADSVPHRAWLHAQKSCVVLASLGTFHEIERVLHREKMNRYADTATRDRFLEKYESSVRWIVVSPSQLIAVEPACRDPKDNIFLALACR